MQTPSAAQAGQAAFVAETITVTDTTVACDGGGGALGHPRVFLKLVDGRVVCPYCSRTYVLAAAGGGKAG
ncbi:zinc-finger domain-containing protein [Elioraea rosea]|uniref:zinc-finger domain-containing protein n=1 Tax=Elioraea rosea TaxID=2492390 RepID=UPI001182CBF8|nr:zinc-finger domain-containing protein [Elioraea rosea]